MLLVRLDTAHIVGGCLLYSTHKVLQFPLKLRSCTHQQRNFQAKRPQHRQQSIWDHQENNFAGSDSSFRNECVEVSSPTVLLLFPLPAPCVEEFSPTSATAWTMISFEEHRRRFNDSAGSALWFFCSQPAALYMTVPA